LTSFLMAVSGLDKHRPPVLREGRKNATIEVS
jgi:hypothetical protein